MIRRILGIGLLLPVVMAAQSPGLGDPDRLLRAGNDAFRRGDLSGAITLYEQAQRRAADPGLVAFNIATVKYHLAVAGDARALADAEVGYRCCLTKGDSRRARALFGLGNCLLLRGSTGRLDGLSLRAAIDRYTLCLRYPNCDPPLAADARHNQQRARLLLLQIPPGQTASPEQDPGDEENPKDETKDPSKPPDRDPHGGNSGETKPEKGMKTAPENGKEKVAEKAGQTVGGTTSLPPVPDDPDAAPLAERIAVEKLEVANRRIQEDLVRHRRGRTRPGSTSVRDW